MLRLNNTAGVQDISYVETSMLNYILQVHKPASCHPPSERCGFALTTYTAQQVSIFSTRWVSGWAEVFKSTQGQGQMLTPFNHLTTSRDHPRRHSQVSKPIKLLYGNGDAVSGALILSTVILWSKDQHFILSRSIGVYGKPSPVDHQRIFISCPCWRAPFYRPMLILACLTEVSGLSMSVTLMTSLS